MNDKPMTPDQIRRAGLEALYAALGPVGMVRFLRQFEVGKGDYSKDRHDLLSDCDVESVGEIIRERAWSGQPGVPAVKPQEVAGTLG